MRRRQWAGAVVGVGGLLLLASLVAPWFAVRSAGTVDRRGFFLMFAEYAPPAGTTSALAALGVGAVLAGACSALSWPVPRLVYVVLGLLLLAAFVHLAWVLAQIPRVRGVEELVAPSPGLFFALAGPLIGAAGSLGLAVIVRKA